jgi:hypothetical protein
VPVNVAATVVPARVWPQVIGVALQIKSFGGVTAGAAQVRANENAELAEKPETAI